MKKLLIKGFLKEVDSDGTLRLSIIKVCIWLAVAAISEAYLRGSDATTHELMQFMLQ